LGLEFRPGSEVGIVPVAGLLLLQVAWSSLRPRRSMKIPMPSSSEAAALGYRVRVGVW
jgi:hypothetical protein